MKMMSIPIAVEVNGAVPKVLEKTVGELKSKERNETIHILVFLKSIGILRRVLESGGDMLSLIFFLCEKPQIRVSMKSSKLLNDK